MTDNSLFHIQDVDKTAKQLNVNLQEGLSANEARQRLADHGPNEIQLSQKRGPWFLFINQFMDFMIVILLIAAVVSGLIGEAHDTIAIFVIIILNAVIGFVQDYRAERALEALRRMSEGEAAVRRDGKLKRIPNRDLVPGDIVMLQAGDMVPADLRLYETHQLSVNEAPLTGESVAVSKDSHTLDEPEKPLGERSNMIYRGCTIDKGRGFGIAVATGMETEFGKIAGLLDRETAGKTPLQHRLANFGKRLAIAILVICAVIFVFGLARGEPVALMFLTAISLAVAAIPEALPAVVTISLALGASRMIKLNALIRRLPAVEALGSVTYICSDKTGTLTQNRMQLKSIYVVDRFINNINQEIASNELLTRALIISNDVELNEFKEPVGDPTEIALYQGGIQSGQDKSELQKKNPRIAEVPFDATRKRMTTIHRTDSGIISFTKGAPEQVLPHCNEQLVDGFTAPIDRVRLEQVVNQYARQGFRVLCIACRNWTALPEKITERQIERKLTFLGLAALMDPARPEAAEAVKTCRKAGIIPVMITGDHPATAQAIAREVHIASDESAVITGQELAKLDQKQREQAVLNHCVYARVTPEQKLQLVEALQANGHFVAMTGDGVNDAPALKRADVGVSMGKIGTDVAREVSDLILLDDNFATIVAAVREGRRIFDNIRKFIKYTMTSNTGEILTLLLAPFLGMPIPLIPIQILWINLVTDGLPGLALSVEPEEKNIMQRPPRARNENIFVGGMWQHMLVIGTLIAGLSLLSQWIGYSAGSTHWQTMVFTTLTISQLVHSMVIRSETESLFTLGLKSNKPLLWAILLTVLLQLMVIYVPFFQTIFNTEALTPAELAISFGLALFVFVFVEIEKWMIRHGYLYKRHYATYRNPEPIT